MARGINARGPSAGFDDRLEQIYRVSIDVFSERGFVAGTTSQIANRVGLTQPALYHYVGGKHAFLVLICERIGSRLLEGMNDALAHEGSAVERLRRFVSRHLETITQESAAFGVYVNESRHLPDSDMARIRDQERDYVHAFTSLIEAAQAEGSLTSTLEPWMYGRLALGAMNWTHRWYHGQVPLDRLVEDFFQYLGITVSA